MVIAVMHDHFHNPVGVFEHVRIRKSKNTVALRFKPTGSFAIMLALSTLIGFCFAKMFGGGFTTMGLTSIAFAGLIARYIGPLVQPKVRLAVLALAAEGPKR